MKTCSAWLPTLPVFWLLLVGAMIDASYHPAQAQWGTVINMTNHTWKYLVEGTNQGTAWRERDFDDSSWISGVGLFGFESTPGVYPYRFQTTWLPIDGRITYYARTHFQWNGSNWPDVLLRATNYIDDGAVFYLNGVEIGRVRLTNEVVEFDTPAQPSFAEGQPDVLEFRIHSMQRGDNVLAVEIHNASPLSHDIVFGMSMAGTECHSDLFPRVTPDFQVVEECRSATITLVSPPFFGPAMRWMVDGVPIPSATNNVLHIPRTNIRDTGDYYVEILTPCDPERSPSCLLIVLPDTTPPQPLRAVADSTLTNLTVTFSEPLDPASIDATNFIVDDVCLPGRLKTQFATLLDPTNVLVTTSPRRLDQNYVVAVSGIRDACAGNILDTNATVVLSPAVPLDSLRLARTLAGLQIEWTGCGVLQWTSNLVHWADVPDVAASPYPTGPLVDTRFYRLRLP